MHIILCSDTLLTINGGINCSGSKPGSLAIYRKPPNADSEGRLTINSSGTGINVNVLNYTQYGGIVTIDTTDNSAPGISAAADVNIMNVNGGSATIDSDGESISAGNLAGGAARTGRITITNGQVSANREFVAGAVDTSDYIRNNNVQL